ncbi:hypothetical protein F2Q69_00057776 [Brassica cretica]|uniref:Uncharacterized protein n=1 Tax=Brassica cretica TaxID=69181 RepID=A0A8S9N583_BRACR|nr:hypothetical protein F2Q69_00057776 [Brassica cretica]
MKLFTSKMASLAFFVVILSIYIVEIDKGTKGSAENDFISKNSMYMFCFLIDFGVSDSSRRKFNVTDHRGIRERLSFQGSDATLQF